MCRTLILIGCVVSCAVSAQADQLTFRNSADGYHSQIDLCIYNQNITDQWRTNGVRSDGTLGLDGDAIAQSLVQFADIIGSGTGRITPGSTIHSATLTLYTRRDTSTDPGSAGRVRAYRMTADWDTGSDWTTFEPWGGTDGITLAGVFVSERSTGVSQTDHAPNDIDLTDAVQAWATGAANHGVGLMFTSGDAADFSSTSDELDYRPLLAVDYTVPEPISGALFAAGVALITIRRRR